MHVTQANVIETATQPHFTLSTDFLSNFSHELKTPLSSIVGLADMLEKTNLDKAQKNMLKTITDASDLLVKTINDTLDAVSFHKVEFQEEFTEFNLREIICDLIASRGDKISHIALRIRFEISPSLSLNYIGDIGRIKQLLSNIIDNAIKFTSKGEIVICIEKLTEYSEDGFEKIKLSIQDTGIGIPKDFIKNVFEPFTQYDSSKTRSHEGVGLGLFISQEIALRMGSHIQIDSQEGKGSKFSFELNLQVSKKQSVHIKEENLCNFEDKKILYFEHLEPIREMTKNCIEDWGAGCDLVTNEEQLFERLSKQKYDLIMIGNLNVYDLWIEIGKKIKSDTKYKDIPIILLTSTGLRGEPQNALQAGYTSYITGGFSSKKLMSAIGQTFEQYQSKVSKVLTSYDLNLSQQRHANILLVEDNLINQKIIKKMIVSTGSSCDVVSNGKEAVRQVSLVKYDLIFMDIQMPEMDGLTATKIIRSQEKPGKHMSIVALTANHLESDRKKCFDAGMDFFIAKPVKSQTLQSAILEYAQVS